jgi:hypothetical protein
MRDVTTDSVAIPVAITKLLKNILRAVISLKNPAFLKRTLNNFQ